MRRKAKYMNYEAVKITVFANKLLQDNKMPKSISMEVATILEFVLLKNNMYYGCVLTKTGSRRYYINYSEKLNLNNKSVMRKHNDVTKSLIYLYQKSEFSKGILMMMMEQCDHMWVDLKNIELDDEFIKRMEML